jgi:hypothetical protein
VKLKNNVKITNGENAETIFLPKGTVLYYKGFNVKNTHARAYLKITEEIEVFEEYIEFINEPGAYFFDVPKEMREKYEPKF